MSTFSADQSNQALKPFGPSVLMNTNQFRPTNKKPAMPRFGTFQGPKTPGKSDYDGFNYSANRENWESTRIKEAKDINKLQEWAIYAAAGLMFIGLVYSTISLFTL